MCVCIGDRERLSSIADSVFEQMSIVSVSLANVCHNCNFRQ